MKVRVFKSEAVEKLAEYFSEPTVSIGDDIYRVVFVDKKPTLPELWKSGVDILKKGVLPLALIGMAGYEIWKQKKLPAAQQKAFDSIVNGDPYLEENRDKALELFKDIAQIAPVLSTKPNLLGPILRQAVTYGGITPDLATSIAKAEEALTTSRGVVSSTVKYLKAIPEVKK